MKENITDLNEFHELPPIEWPAYFILAMLILILIGTALYVRSRTRIGFNDAPPEQETDEDNSIIEALRWHDTQKY